MPARKRKIYINLLPSEEFQFSAMGRVLKWALTTFRVMVIVCEMVVMGAFLSRFWLDARISDLNDEINISRSQIQAYKSTEDEFRLLQKKLSIIKQLYSDSNNSQLLEVLTSRLPNDVFLSSLSVVEQAAQIKANAFSEKSILQFISNLNSSNQFADLSLGQVSTNQEDVGLVGFTLTAKLK